MGQQRVCLAIQTIQEPKIEKKKVKARERAKVDQKERREHSLVKSKHRNQSCGQKKIVLGRPKEIEARKAFRNVMKAFGWVEFALTHQQKVHAVISTRTKAEARTKKERAMKVLILNQDFQPMKTPLKRDKAILGNQTIGIPAYLTIPLVQLAEAPLHAITQVILHGWHQSL